MISYQNELNISWILRFEILTLASNSVRLVAENIIALKFAGHTAQLSHASKARTARKLPKKCIVNLYVKVYLRIPGWSYLLFFLAQAVDAHYFPAMDRRMTAPASFVLTVSSRRPAFKKSCLSLARQPELRATFNYVG